MAEILPSLNAELEELALKTRAKLMNENSPVRKTLCRYGLGCTQVFDPVHKEKFWHPSVPRLNDEQIKSQFICNECGYGTSSLTDLQVHLKRKTAWTNSSLLGCRISCLVDYREWHEGVVTQFHKSGKHFVEFRLVNEKRWLLMRKIAFYIVQRPPVPTRHFGSIPGGGSDSVGMSGEFKDSNGDVPQEEAWVYSEDISTEYAFAQSVLFKIYGNSVQETGHLTKGHVCLTDSDRAHAQHIKVSLLYGELLPRGANKAFGPKRLSAATGQVLYDLGMGTGKILVQAFLQFKNLKYVYGVEMSVGRYKLAEESLLKMVTLLGRDNYQVEMCPGKYIVVTEGVRSDQPNARDAKDDGDDDDTLRPDVGSKSGGSPRVRSRSRSETENDFECGERVLHLECGNLFDVASHIHMADMVMMETDIPVDLHPDLHRLLGRMRDGSRLLSYLDLRRIWEHAPQPIVFRQLDVNRHLSDRYPTSWSVQRGHHFYFWTKVDIFLFIVIIDRDSFVPQSNNPSLHEGAEVSHATSNAPSRAASGIETESSLVSFHHHPNSTNHFQSHSGPTSGSRVTDSDRGVSANEARDPSDFDRRQTADDEYSEQLDNDDQSLMDEGQCLPCFLSSALLGWLRRRLSGGSKSRVSVGMFDGPVDDPHGELPLVRDSAASLRRSAPSLQPSDHTNRSETPGELPISSASSFAPVVGTVTFRTDVSKGNHESASDTSSTRKSKKTSGKACTAESFAALSPLDAINGHSQNRLANFPSLTFTPSVPAPLNSNDTDSLGTRRTQMKSDSLVSGGSGKRPTNLLDSSGGGLYFGLQDSEGPPLYGYREGDDSTHDEDAADPSFMVDLSESQRSDDGINLPALSSNGYGTPPRGTNYEEGSSPNVMLTFRTAPSPSPLLAEGSSPQKQQTGMVMTSSKGKVGDENKPGGV